MEEPLIPTAPMKTFIGMILNYKRWLPDSPPTSAPPAGHRPVVAVRLHVRLAYK